MPPRTPSAPRWHVPFLVVLSVAFEALFLRHGLNLLDEGWPLYAASRLGEGGVLYRDVFFVFPPGHLLAAWVGGLLAPPGVVAARVIYAAFAVAACLSVYLLGRRLMPAGFALLGGCLLAVAAPEAHLWHTLFGYRYFALSGFAMLAFAWRLAGGGRHALVLAGLLAGLGLCFRITPALAVMSGIGVGILAGSRNWRGALADGTTFALGLALVIVPVGGWLLAGAGAEALWRELLVRPVVMTDLQGMGLPALALPAAWSRAAVTRTFEAAQFRLYLLLYAAYAVACTGLWVRAWLRGQAFGHALLLAVATFGGVYFLRTLGRSDAHHLYSALPPVCLLLAHLASLCFDATVRWVSVLRRPALARGAVCLGLFGAWVLLMGSDGYLSGQRRGTAALASLGGAVAVPWPAAAQRLDRTVRDVLEATDPDDVLLDLGAHPMLHVLTGRAGPGHLDVVMPGTFLDDAEEERFLRRLEADPPAVVHLRLRPFDGRHVTESYAPRVAAWVEAHYASSAPRGRYGTILLFPR